MGERRPQGGGGQSGMGAACARRSAWLLGVFLVVRRSIGSGATPWEALQRSLPGMPGWGGA